MSYEFEGLFASQGWQCPICKRVYSPYTPMCYYCGGEQKTTVSTTGTGVYEESPRVDATGKVCGWTYKIIPKTEGQK